MHSTAKTLNIDDGGGGDDDWREKKIPGIKSQEKSIS
jgi:hypothetical protein